MVFRSVRLSLDGPNGSVIFVDVRPSPGKAFRGHLRGSTPTSTSYDSYGCLLEIYHSPTFNIQHSRQTLSYIVLCIPGDLPLATNFPVKSNIYSQRASLASVLSTASR
jgi:hypothetical protein